MILSTCRKFTAPKKKISKWIRGLSIVFGFFALGPPPPPAPLPSPSPLPCKFSKFTTYSIWNTVHLRTRQGTKHRCIKIPKNHIKNKITGQKVHVPKDTTKRNGTQIDAPRPRGPFFLGTKNRRTGLAGKKMVAGCRKNNPGSAPENWCAKNHGKKGSTIRRVRQT